MRSPRFLVIGLAILPALCAVPAGSQTEDRFREQRLAMVREFIEKEGVRNPRVLEAMRTVPRHEFTRSVDKLRAYVDGALPIGYKQTISPPFIVAYMTETLDPQPDDKVLEIGTGSGYQAAVLSGLVKEVYTIEIVEPLGKSAEQKLRRLGYDNVHCLVGDGYKGWPEHAPFDKIIVTCSPEKVPRPLVDQLKDGGRMIIPLGERYQQVFHLFEKKEGKLEQKRLIPTLFVPMTGISEEKRERQPDPANPELVNGGFEVDDNEDGQVDNWHYQRLATWASDDAPEGKRYVAFENGEKGRLAQMLQGFAIDGTKVGALRVSLRVKYEQTAPGEEDWEVPSMIVLFYDNVRRSINRPGVVGPFVGTVDNWRHETQTISVPLNAREAIVRIGLAGGTGKIQFDDVSIHAVKR